MRAVTIVQANVLKAPPASAHGAVGAFNTGDYRRRWQYQLSSTGGRIFNNHPAAGVIEHGRRSGRKSPPPREIELWARRRLGLSAEEAARAAWPIARAIAKRGLRARKVLGMSSAAITRVVMEEIRNEVREAIKRGGR
jgi:hypothetical protein